MPRRQHASGHFSSASAADQYGRASHVTPAPSRAHLLRLSLIASSRRAMAEKKETLTLLRHSAAHSYL
jgi:hypothetical protein